MSTPGLTLNQTDRFTGLLLGTAIGDALGLPAENLSAEKIRCRWRGDWRMRLIFGRGMVSDDTEHTLMVAQALLAQPCGPVHYFWPGLVPRNLLFLATVIVHGFR